MVWEIINKILVDKEVNEKLKAKAYENMAVYYMKIADKVHFL